MQAEILIGKRKGMSNFFRQFSTHLNLKQMEYKIQESVFGIFKWGEFQPLPKIDFVLIFKQLYAKCEDCTVDDFENSINSYYQISLVYNKNRRLVVHESRDREEAFEMAEKLAIEFKKPLMDSATNRRKGVWVNLP